MSIDHRNKFVICFPRILSLVICPTQQPPSPSPKFTEGGWTWFRLWQESTWLSMISDCFLSFCVKCAVVTWLISFSCLVKARFQWNPIEVSFWLHSHWIWLKLLTGKSHWIWLQLLTGKSHRTWLQLLTGKSHRIWLQLLTGNSHWIWLQWIVDSEIPLNLITAVDSEIHWIWPQLLTVTTSIHSIIYF